MRKTIEQRYFMCDFETSVYKGQKDTEVWASALVELGTEDVIIHSSIHSTFNYFKCMFTENLVLYYHNLKFDGSFWVDYLLKAGLKQAYTQIDPADPHKVQWLDTKDMENDSFKYSISMMGQWYTIIIKVNNNFIEIRDSYKLLPFSVKKIGKSFKTKHQKLEMEYEGERHAGYVLTDEERKYIENDVLVVKEALELMFSQGHDALTIGACCLREFKKTYDKTDYANFFPNLYEVELDERVYDAENAGEYIRKAYRGGWCYVVKGKENKIYHKGCTVDVNSLYPSMMHSVSGNYYPVGLPCFWDGNYIPDKATKPNRFYYVRVRTRFYLKEGYLPFIQLKGYPQYDGTESLESSDIWSEKDQRYYQYYTDSKGQVHYTRVTMTLSQVDYELIKKHYNLVDFEILDGCWFYAEIGLFDEYIDKYKKQKQESTGAVREQAKLFLNNLYGKMASSPDSSFKVAYLKENNAVGFFPVHEEDKEPGYIAIGAAITAYSRRFTITGAQNNYYGKDKRGFIYADTDSLHCDLEYDELVDIPTHETEFCHWKIEAGWDEAIFARQKTYIEHVVEENCKPVEKEPFYNIKCAGMPKRCKDLFDYSMRGYEPKEGDKFTEEELEFIKVKRTIADFKPGLIVPSKLLPKRIPGGILLTPTSYEMRF